MKKRHSSQYLVLWMGLQSLSLSLSLSLLGFVVILIWGWIADKLDVYYVDHQGYVCN